MLCSPAWRWCGAGDWLTRRRPRLAPFAVAALTLLVLLQGLIADVRTTVVLGREDTRLEARRYLACHYPPQLRISIEPAIPDRFYRAAPDGRLPSWLGRCGARRLLLPQRRRADGCASPRSRASSAARRTS